MTIEFALAEVRIEDLCRDRGLGDDLRRLVVRVHRSSLDEFERAIQDGLSGDRYAEITVGAIQFVWMAHGLGLPSRKSLREGYLGHEVN